MMTYAEEIDFTKQRKNNVGIKHQFDQRNIYHTTF